VDEEACPHDLTPTCSTTAALALGDALAVVLLLQREFRKEDFARLHPGGSLGRRLLKVSDVMITEDFPLLPPDAPMKECVVLLAEKRGTVGIVDAGHRLLGVVTAGDLTRVMDRDPNFLALRVADVMTRTPKTAEPDQLAASAVGVMERHGVMALPVLDPDRTVVGMVHLHDLMRARVV
jgi:arabinose-5-phosphate isomerase